ncbi:MAG TPA: cation-translocating P-type ATPase [Anaeromyxobacteraceae bacterium]|nr:cation-translocating P-type ATPase [Anaeromyxobacteraceae bacterium]
MGANGEWHALEAGEALERLGSGPAGLSPAEAERRLAASGPNEIERAEPVSPWRILLAQLRNVLVVILLAATGLSAALGHGLESLVIAAIVLLAVALGFVQEYRAERAIDALRRLAAPAATVIRGGAERRIPAREVVPGDLLVLHTGDRVPADGRVVESVNLKADEAALTGESVPVEKQAGALPAGSLPVGDRRNMVHAGTSVAYGRGRALVVATGMATEFGQIARMFQAVEPGRTPLQKNLDRVGSALAKAALGVVALIVTAGLLRGQPLVEMILFGIALAVAVVPEALPAVVTISLAIGVQRMVRRNALIRRLPAVETLGSTSVICSDKTGTLTRDEMTVRRLHVAGETLAVTGAGYEPSGTFTRGGRPVEPSAPLNALLEAGCLASDATLSRGEEGRGWRIAGDPTEGALVVAAAKAGIRKAALEAERPRVGEIPFSSESKRMTTLHRTAKGVTAYAKGAPEVLLPSCDAALGPSGPVPLDDAGRDALFQVARGMAADALRVLAVASRADATPGNAERGLTFLGLVGMIDPPRDEVPDAIARCREAGIRPLMITGDHPETAQAVARELALLGRGRVVTGRELDGWDEDRLRGEVEDVDVFARVSPAHKLRVVEALQANGRVVAVTGDGVNDAPALRRADIGVAMGLTGTDVSREAADMTLTDDSFASIVAAVEEGRQVFGNVKKYLMYLLSSNIGEIGLMAGAVLLGLPLPLTAVQILWVNLATDGLPALALAVDPPEADLMRRGPRDPRRGIFTRPVVALMLAGGAWSTLVNVSLFAWLLRAGRDLEEAMAMTFVSLVLIQFVKAYAYRSDHASVLQAPLANRWLNAAVGGELVVIGLVVYLPLLQAPFGTFAFGAADWLAVGLAAASIAPVLEAAKWAVRRGWLGEAG